MIAVALLFLGIAKRPLPDRSTTHFQPLYGYDFPLPLQGGHSSVVLGSAPTAYAPLDLSTYVILSLLNLDLRSRHCVEVKQSTRVLSGKALAVPASGGRQDATSGWTHGVASYE